MDAYTELLNKIKKIEEKSNQHTNSINTINKTFAIIARKSDVETEAARLRGEISQLSSVITSISDKLSKVYLPNESKYYLDETELQNMRKKIGQMNSMLIRLQNLEKTILQSLSRLDSQINTI